MKERIRLENGKYTFINDNGLLTCKRHGAAWREFVGDGAVLALFQYAYELQRELASREFSRDLHSSTHEAVMGINPAQKPPQRSDEAREELENIDYEDLWKSLPEQDREIVEVAQNIILSERHISISLIDVLALLKSGGLMRHARDWGANDTEVRDQILTAFDKATED